MVIILFEHRLRADIDQAEWEETFGRMVDLASQIPGFISIAGYAGSDGGGLAVVKFDSEESLQTWKTDPEHLQVQARGREAFFDSYNMTVATTIVREYGYEH